MSTERQRPPRRAAAETSPQAGNEGHDHRTDSEPHIEVEAVSNCGNTAVGHPKVHRVPVDGYRRGTGARVDWYRDRVTGWRDRLVTS